MSVSQAYRLSHQLTTPDRPSGETKQEAIANIKAAIEGYVVSLEEDGLPVPEERFEVLVVAV